MLQVKWLKKNVGQWGGVLQACPGVCRVLDTRVVFTPYKSPLGSSRFSDGQGPLYTATLAADLFLHGRFLRDRVACRELQRELVALLKRKAAESILQNSPPPFKLDPPLFLAGNDTFYVCLSYNKPADDWHVHPDAHACLMQEALLPKLQEVVAGQGARFLGLSDPLQIGKPRAEIAVCWEKDVDHATRQVLREMIMHDVFHDPRLWVEFATMNEPAS